MESISILTSIDQELFWFVLNQVSHISQASTFFDTDNIWMISQAKHGFWS
ncbi:Uncharacterised protein [Mycobacterium tuberculosis]|nr:Uncharacterised protein [Mycobacterium tuberculosis]